MDQSPGPKKTSNLRSSPSHWDAYYHANRNLFDKYLPQHFIIDNILRLFGGNIKNKQILEAGCGRGLDSMALAKLGARISTVDFSENAIELLTQKCEEEGLTMNIRQGDLRTIEFEEGTFDCIFHSGVLEHFSESDQSQILRKQWAWLKKGGILFAEAPQRYNVYTLYKKFMMAINRWAPGWETEFSKNQLRKLMEQNGFRVLEIIGRDFFTIVALRKLFKILGYRGKPPGRIAKILGAFLQGNRILTNFYLNIAAIGIKE